MAQTVVVSGVNYSVPDPGDQPNWGTGLTPFFVAIAAAAASTPSFMQYTAVSATPTTMVSGHTYLVNSASLAIQMNLPTPAQNAWVIVKDSGFNAFTNNITIHRAGSEKIDNVAADFVMSASGSVYLLMSNGTDWFVIAAAGDLVLKDIADGNRYRVLTNSGVLSTQQVT